MMGPLCRIYRATGGSWENQDILSWTFEPVAKTAQVAPGQTAVLPFQNNAYN
jgi:cytochrome c oxidase assembly protein Cox11